MKHRLSFLVLASILLTLAVSASAASAPPSAQDPDDVFVARVYYRTGEDIKLLAGFDVFEYNNRTERYFLVAVDRAGLGALSKLGLRVAIDAEETARFTRLPAAAPEQIGGIPGYPCYRTVEETFQAGQDIVAAHPNLATWIDAGDSWEKGAGQADGYDMRVLVLTNSAIAGPKPKLFITAAIHAREYTTAELATRFAEYLVGHYNVDPDATWLLDYHEIHLMFYANPDGRKEAEAGYSWRKSTNENYCGATSAYRGADLNRNFSFYWNSCAGCSSGYECDETYRGPAPASEPETQAIESYLKAIFPDQRDAGLSSPAPTDATGVYLDLHSFSELVLWPWGFAASAAPNHAALQTLGRKFAYYNSYTPQQSYQLYGTDGATEDFAYGELGVAAYTFELGTAFFQGCSTFENTILPANIPALVYAAKVARAPYLTPAGPDALSVTVSPAAVTIGADVTLTAIIDDARYNHSNGTEPAQAIAAAEYYIDVPPWQTGAVAHAMTAADGSFNGSAEGVGATVNTAGLTPGRHLIFVRGQDAGGAWGAFSAVFLDTQMFTITPASRAVCAPADAEFIVNVGYAASVAFSASGQPDGATTIFAPNPVSGPNAGTLTIGGIGGATAGSYIIDVTGTGGGFSQTTPVQLEVATTGPATATLIAPADGSTGVAAVSTFTWNAADQATRYDIELSTDPAFANIVASASGLTGLSFTPEAALAMDTVYYWRVRSANACVGAWSPAAAFRTVAIDCVTYTSTDVPQAIRDLAWAHSTLSVPDNFTITDVNVVIGRIDHTWDTDLGIYIQHPDNTEVMLSTDNGSYNDNYVNTVFDDEAATAITEGLAPFTGSYRPEALLSGLDGKNAAGAWKLNIYDDGTGDMGTLRAWSLVICGGPTSGAADYSDLAAGYGVAWHTGAGAVRLGSLWDADTAFSAGYDDARSDDGVTRGAWTDAVDTVDITVAGNTGYVAGWFDWNEDGDFADDGEQAFANEQVDAGQTRTVSFAPGAAVYGRTIAARFRVYPAPQPASQTAGPAVDGEVEDYAWHFSTSGVTLASFTAETTGGGVLLTWGTLSEMSNRGFNLYRAEGGAGGPAYTWVKLNDALIPVAAPGPGGGRAYTWLDATAQAGTAYIYRLETVALDGTVEIMATAGITFQPTHRRWLPLAQ